MASVNSNVAKTVSGQAFVVEAVRAERDRVADIARGLFAPHDNPGGHEITTEDGRRDAFVVFEGPAPLSVEFGHWTPDHKTRVEGLHILLIATAQAAL